MPKRRNIGSVQIISYTDDIKNALPELLNQAMFEGAQDILDVAKAKAPVSSGTLRDSGYVAVKDKTTYQEGPRHRKEIRPDTDGAAVVGFAAFYARYIELGTAKLAAKPFLRPALDERKDDVGKRIVAVVSEGLE